LKTISLFNLNFMDGFGTSWAKYSNAVAGDRDLALYRAAWEAGWGPPATLRSGAATLATARASRETAALANRLTLAVAFSRADIAAYEQSLADLVDTHADRVSDHLGHWRLLLNAGQRQRAAELARAYSNPPDTPNDAMAMADLFLELGLPEYAATFLEKQLPNFNFRPDIWQRLGEIYVGLNRWEDLRYLAVNVRASERIRPDQNGFAWFLEGIAQLKLGHREFADEAFARAVDFPPNDPLLSYRIALGLSQYGYDDAATLLLQKLEQDFGGMPEYWFQVVTAAYQARKFDIMHAAAQKGYELATNNSIFINNYAAALLIQRTNSPLAIELTVRRLAMAPTDPGAHLNHALALLQNGRYGDAEVELNRLNPDDLDSYYNTVRQLGFFELYYRRGNRAEALKAYEGIEARFLMPPQLRWVEETHQQLLKPGESKPGN
jgi:predicted Zn-dependent protease